MSMPVNSQSMRLECPYVLTMNCVDMYESVTHSHICIYSFWFVDVQSIVYYNDGERSPVLQDFKPFDLESWWGKRIFNSITKSLWICTYPVSYIPWRFTSHHWVDISLFFGCYYINPYRTLQIVLIILIYLFENKTFN